MRANDRLLAGGLTLALVATLLPAAAVAADLVPGRPGRHELSSITIDATSGDCRATYETPAADNLWMRGVDATVRVLSNPNWVRVTCRFTDMSALIEANAEVGHTEACTLVTETTTYVGGWGIATSAANVSERAEGGNSVAMCRFRVEPEPAVKGPARAGRTAGPGEGSAAGEPGRSVVARASKPATRAGDARPAERRVTKSRWTQEAHGSAQATPQSADKVRKVSGASGKAKRRTPPDKPGRER